MTVHPAFPVDGAPMPMAPAPLTVRVVDPLSLSAALAAGLDALAAEASAPNPFVERWCLQSSLHLRDSDRQSRIVIDRKNVLSGQRVSGSVGVGGRLCIVQKLHIIIHASALYITD